MRGYCYYTLATLFGDAYVPGGANDGKQLPLRTTFSREVEQATTPKIATTQELWAQILVDLKKPMIYFPNNILQGKCTFHIPQAGQINLQQQQC